MNKIQIMGHLGGDPVVRVTPSGAKVTSFTVAVKGRKKEEKPTWFRISIWGDSFDKVLSYLKKGSAVIVYGELSISQWENPNNPGDKRLNLDIRAQSIDFSPFGKPEQEGEAPAPKPAPAPTVSPNMPFTTKTANGAAKRSDPIEKAPWDNNDEVPF